MSRRVLLSALAALLAPIPALALDSDPGQAAIEVGAGLGSCGLVQQQVVCEVAVTYSSVEGAASYEVSIVGPDGSAVSHSAGAGGTTMFVPYAGSGTYSVQVVAYGTAEPEDEKEQGAVLSRGNAGMQATGQQSEGPRGPHEGSQADGESEGSGSEAQPDDPGAPQPETGEPQLPPTEPEPLDPGCESAPDPEAEAEAGAAEDQGADAGREESEPCAASSAPAGP